MKRLLIIICFLSALLMCSCSSNQNAYKAGFEAGLAAAQANVTPQPTRRPTETPAWKPAPTPVSMLPYVGTYAAQPVAKDGCDYVLNRNTKKFHYPDCSSVDDMKESNKIYFNGTRDEAIEKGYVPCKRCNP